MTFEVFWLSGSLFEGLGGPAGPRPQHVAEKSLTPPRLGSPNGAILGTFLQNIMTKYVFYIIICHIFPVLSFASEMDPLNEGWIGDLHTPAQVS